MFFKLRSGFIMLTVLLVVVRHAYTQPVLENTFSIGSNGDDQALSSIPDEEGNYYIVGKFTGQVDFDPDKSATYNLVSSGNSDAYIAKYDSTDDFVWVVQIGNSTSSLIEGSYITLDSDGNLIIAFDIVSSDPIDFDPDTGTCLISPSGRAAVYAKYTTKGQLKWAKMFDNCYVSYFETDESGNTVLPLRYDSSCDLDPGPGSQIAPLTGVLDAAIVKLDSLGNLVWGFTLASIGSDKIGGMDIDENDNIYISGRLGGSGNWDVDPGAGVSIISGPSGYLAKYDANGNFVWVKADPNFNLTKLRLNYKGHVVVGGSITGTVDLDLDTGALAVHQVSSAGDRDAFMAAYDTTDCSFVESIVFGNSDKDGVNSFVLDDSGYYYITGDMTDVVDFDPGPHTVYIANSGRNAYIAKFSDEFDLMWVEVFPFFLNGTSKGQLNVDFNQDIIITATFEGTAYMDFSPPTTHVKSHGDKDFVVARYRQPMVESIPTVGEWGMIFLCMGSMLIGLYFLRRKV